MTWIGQAVGVPSGMPSAIEVQGLSKQFGPLKAVDELSFEVYPGQVTGFLGPNGAGKSTTLRMVLGAAGRVEAGGLEHGSDVVDGVVQLHIPAPAERSRSLGDGDQAEQHPQRRGLAGAVGPEEAGDPARGHLEAETVDGPEGSELLGETLDFDGRRHVRRYPGSHRDPRHARPAATDGRSGRRRTQTAA